MPLQVITCGLNVVDVLFKLPATVVPGTKHPVGEISIQGGAPAANAACVIATLGKTTGFLARMGQNTLSDIARAELQRHGVSAELFIDDPQALPAVAVVQTDAGTGERTVFYSLENYHHLNGEDVPIQAVQRAEAVLVDSYQPEAALKILSLAKGHCQSVVDLESGDPDVLWELLKLAGHAILPLAAARTLSSEDTESAVLKSLSTRTNAQLIVTDGPRGSWALGPDSIIHTPALKVEVQDTTGCGDAFHGAYCVALLNGLTLPRRIEYASFVAAQVATWLGGRKGLPSLRASVSRFQRQSSTRAK